MNRGRNPDRGKNVLILSTSPYRNWRFVGRARGAKNRRDPGRQTQSPARPQPRARVRVANAEIHDNETTDTAIGVLRRAVGWFGARGVSVARVLCDNGFCYRSHAWRDACAELQIQYKRTRPYRPQTNGKI